MADIRTVLDVAGDDCKAVVHLLCPCLDVACALAFLGVDPDMPFEDFARWLRYGKNADELLELRRDWQRNRIPDGSTDTWNGCLDAIKDGG